MDPELSVVVPLHNEGGNVVPLTRQIFDAFRNEPRRFELILVDDGSTDDTWERVLEVFWADPRVRALRHRQRAGQSAALWTGFKASRGGTLLTLDGDLQNDPADLSRLLAELEDYDLVCGMRIKRMDNWLRRFSSAVARITRRLVLKADFRDTGCNLRAFKRSVLETIPPFNGFHRFLPILAQRGGAAVKEIPVAHHPRFAGKANYGIGNRLGRGIYDVIMVRWYLKRHFLPVTTFENPRPEPTGPGAIPPSRSAE